MASDVDRELGALRRLLPPGLAWTRLRDGVLDQLLRGLGAEYCNVSDRATDLLREADPSTTLELLEEWERVAGLPGDCAEPPTTITGRRLALVEKLTALGGQSPAYFIAVAAALGYDISIVEYRPFKAGPSSGDPWNDGSASRAGDKLTNGDWLYAWTVQAAGETVRSFKAGSLAGEPLRVWSNTLLECVLGRLKPAHTHLLFEYGEDAEPPKQPVAYERVPDASTLPCYLPGDFTFWIRNHNARVPTLTGDTVPPGTHGDAWLIGTSAGAIGVSRYENSCGLYGEVGSKMRLELFCKKPATNHSKWFDLKLAWGDPTRIEVASSGNRFKWRTSDGKLVVDSGAGTGSVQDLGGDWYLAKSEHTVGLPESGEKRWAWIEMPEGAPWPDEHLIASSARFFGLGVGGTP